MDSPLRGLERYEGAPIEEIRGATRQALKNLVDLAISEEVAFVLIAGDLYDGDWKDYNTGLFFVSQMGRLSREGIRVVIIRGNHDAASQITGFLRLPDGVVDLSTKKAESQILEDLGVAIHGQGYAKRDITDDLVSAYPPALEEYFNIGLLHTAVDGREGHDLYAPCRVDELISKGYQYWALGHVHKREVLSEDPMIIFPGNLQGRHVREAGPKGATVVTVEDGGILNAEHRHLDAVRWAECTVDVTEAASGYDVIDQVRSSLEREADSTGGLTLAARVTIVGRSKAHRELSGNPVHWVNQIRAAVTDLGSDLWVEKVLFKTKTPIDIEKLLGHDDPVGGLLRSLRSLRENPEELETLIREFRDIKDKLPPEYARLEDVVDLDNSKTYGSLLEEVEQILVPRLLEAREER